MPRASVRIAIRKAREASIQQNQTNDEDEDIIETNSKRKNSNTTATNDGKTNNNNNNTNRKRRKVNNNKNEDDNNDDDTTKRKRKRRNTIKEESESFRRRMVANSKIKYSEEIDLKKPIDKMSTNDIIDQVKLISKLLLFAKNDNTNNSSNNDNAISPTILTNYLNSSCSDSCDSSSTNENENNNNSKSNNAKSTNSNSSNTNMKKLNSTAPEAITIPPHCVPIRADVRSFDWEALGKEVQFDVITMDPPWQLASSAPSRGVAVSYQQLPNRDISSLPIQKLQTDGFLFIWVINKRYLFALEMMQSWGYELVDDITWVKSTVNRRLAKGHGFYLQHAKETCLVGKKGNPKGVNKMLDASDVIFSERRGQSQKPQEIYHLVEQLVPHGKYLEIFARRNNLRNFWVSVGLEL